MTLNAYLASTQQLLQNPAAPTTLYATALLTGYINQARIQVAGESLSIRTMATLAVTTGNQGPYAFTAFNTGVSATNGVQGILNARTLWYKPAGGLVWMTPRSFDWFAAYNLNSTAPATGIPAEWAQYGQGVNGTIYVSPVPAGNYTLSADTVCYPIALVDDTTVDAVPLLWQTAVPYYAAYLALLSAQTSARIEEAKEMLQLYEMFTDRARRFSNPDILPLQYEQAIQPVQASQYTGGQSRPAGA